MNSIELQEKLINFQKRLRGSLEHKLSIETNDPVIMRKIDYLLCLHETGVKPLRVEVKS